MGKKQHGFGSWGQVLSKHNITEYCIGKAKRHLSLMKNKIIEYKINLVHNNRKYNLYKDYNRSARLCRVGPSDMEQPSRCCMQTSTVSIAKTFVQRLNSHLFGC